MTPECELGLGETPICGEHCKLACHLDHDLAIDEDSNVAKSSFFRRTSPTRGTSVPQAAKKPEAPSSDS